LTIVVDQTNGTTSVPVQSRVKWQKGGSSLHENEMT
jgi:hypothetical protein